MKTIKTISLGSSDYSGKSNRRTELMLKAAPTTDEAGLPLKTRQRYYILRMLSYEHGNRKDCPFIIRNEHICYHTDAEGALTSIEKIVCPSTTWAGKELAKRGEPVGKGYCPICEFSFNKNKEAFRVKGQCDKVSQKLSKQTKRVWAAYWPVYVVQDPNYHSNEQHFKVLRFAEKDKEAFNRLVTLINSLIEQGTNPFNGEEGVNIGILVERETKFLTDKEGNKIISKKTGGPIEFSVNEIKDIRALSTPTEYPEITDEAIDELQFDDVYNVAKGRDELMQFLEDNWLNIGASDDDFDNDFAEPPKDASVKADEEGFEDTTPETPKAAEAPLKNEPSEDFGDDFGLDESEKDETAVDIINGIVGGGAAKAQKKTISKIPPSAESVREKVDSPTASDMDDLPF